MKHKPGFNKNAFLSLIRHLRNKLNANQPYFLDEIMDEDHMLDIYDYFKESTTDKIDDALDELGDDFTEEEVINIQLRTRINDCLDFVQ